MTFEQPDVGGARSVPAPVPGFTAGRAGRALVASHDPVLWSWSARALEVGGFTVLRAGVLRQAVEGIRSLRPDLLVLDGRGSAPGGSPLVEWVRSWSSIPVLLIHPSATQSERVRGLDLGADDVVATDISPAELAARARSILRRAGRVPTPVTKRLVAGCVVVDERVRRATVRGCPVTLTALEFGLLAFFVRHPGEAFERSVLLEQVWGYSSGGLETVTVTVGRLRGKVELDPAVPTLIQTVRGVGYRFDVDEGNELRR